MLRIRTLPWWNVSCSSQLASSARRRTRGVTPVAASPSTASVLVQSDKRPALFASGTTTAAVAANYFHSTAVTPFPVRRRRRGGGGGDSTSSGNQSNNNNSSSSNRTQISNHSQFKNEAGQLLDKLHQAVLPMQPKNDIFLVSRSHEPGVGPNLSIDMGPVLGRHLLQVDEAERIVVYSSPVSGQYNYALVQQTVGSGSSSGEAEVELSWRSIQDDHLLEGMMVRDLIRTAKGVPKL